MSTLQEIIASDPKVMAMLARERAKHAASEVQYRQMAESLGRSVEMLQTRLQIDRKLGLWR